MSTGKIFDGMPVMAFTRPTDRRNFLRWAARVGVGAGFVLGGGVVTAPLASAAGSAPTQQSGGNGDIDILNYALTLEYLEAEFYMQGLAANLLTGRELELVKPIEAHEQAHVQAVMQTVTKLGGMPVAKPMIKFPDGTFGSKDKFLQTARQFEELGVNAYHGQVPNIQSGDVLAAAASIAGVESRHAAILESLTGGDPFPSPIEQPKPMSEVLPQVKPFIS